MSEVALAADSLAKASTPEPVGPKPLWKKPGFKLPDYIEHIANDLREKRGMTESTAIATAIAAVKRWAAGGGKVDAGTRAAATKAVAEWEALKVAAHVTKKRNLSNGDAVATIDLAGPKGYIHGWVKVGGGAQSKPYKWKPGEARDVMARMASVGTSRPKSSRPEPSEPAKSEVPKAPRGTRARAVRHLEGEHGIKVPSGASLKRIQLAHAGVHRHEGTQLHDMSNGGSVTSIDLAGTEPDADDMTVNAMMSHMRASTPKGHGMKVPPGTAPAKLAKMHSYLHRQGNAKHSHGGGKNMSNGGSLIVKLELDRTAFDKELRQAQIDLATLTAASRKKMSSSTFGLPAKKAYPMPDKSHAANAKARAAQMLKRGRITKAQYDKIVAKANKILGTSDS